MMGVAMPLVACPECGAKISKRAAVCPSCGGPVPRHASEWVKDLILVLVIAAIVVTACWVVIDQTIGRAEAARLFAKAFHTRVELTDETVTVPVDEFRGVLLSVPYTGRVTLEIEARGGQGVNAHLIDGADLLRLAKAKPPFDALGLAHHPAFALQAVGTTKRSDRLTEGSYVVVLEHSTRGAPASEVSVVARLAPP